METFIRINQIARQMCAKYRLMDQQSLFIHVGFILSTSIKQKELNKQFDINLFL